MQLAQCYDSTYNPIMIRYTKFVFFWNLVNILICVDATSLYSIVGPGTIHSNHKYNVVASLHKSPEPCKINVGIVGPSYNETKQVVLQPMSTVNLQFDVPLLESGDYNLTAVGVEGILFENSTKLNYATNKPSIYIQTDKATYKPGDLVQFRVIFLDENTRPAIIKNPYSIVINDGAQNRIKLFKDINVMHGVYTSNLSLSDQPVLGQWVIDVMESDASVHTKSFEVAKYVLPKFEVIIETSKEVAIPDQIIKATIRSKYTYGKGVLGKATVSLKPVSTYGPVIDVMAEKTIPMDGKGHVEFDLEKDLGLDKLNHLYMPSLKMLAIVEDELTGNKQNATIQINLHSQRYIIESVETPYTFQLGKPLTYTIVVKHVDGTPVQDNKNKAKLIFKEPGSYFHNSLMRYPPSNDDNIPEQKDLTFESLLNSNGMAKFEIILDNTNASYYSVMANFLDTTNHMSSISKYEKTPEVITQLKIDILTKKPQLGKNVTVELKSNEVIPYFIYTIVGRGNILSSERVDVPNDRKSHTFKFYPSFEMVPRAKLYIHYVYDNNLRFEEATIQFENQFENSIDIVTETHSKPGEDIQMKIKTDPNSFVGLLGVDQSVLLLKSGNDFNKDDIFRDIGKFDTTTPWIRGYGRYPGQTSGLVTLTNANFPYNSDDYYINRKISPGILIRRPVLNSSLQPTTPNIIMNHRIRRQFIENWIFDDFSNSESDEVTLTKRIPDTITSWVITGFSLNPLTGLALTDNPTKIQVFQPFFVSTNLPFSVKRGEVISIPVIIYNYMDKNLDAEVTMDNVDNEYAFTEATNNIEENALDEIKRTKRLLVPANTGKSVSFMIRPTKVGEITLKITAITPLAGDSIHKTLKVEPEGITKFENRAVFVNLKDKKEMQESLKIDIPSDVVPDSEYIEFSVVGDFSVGPTIKNLDKLVRMPYGCGEQNMVNFVPNILVLKYLETTGKHLPSAEEKAKKFLEIGYQRELTYKHDDGSYSAFGKSDKAGSTWLTAYVVRSFHQAMNYTDIDVKTLVEGLDFLASVQSKNGSFLEHGKLFDSAHQNELGLNAFVLLAFLENKELAPRYGNVIQKSIDYLLMNFEQSNDAYSLAITVLALQLSDNPIDIILKKLEDISQKDNDLKWWSKAEPVKQTVWQYRPKSNDVEITSYILLAILEKQGPEACIPIIKWLIKQRNSKGGFSSTQDTVLGLQALISFAEKTGSSSENMMINYVTSGDDKLQPNSFTINGDNSLTLQTHLLSKQTRAVNFTATGEGSCLVQISYRYNVITKENKPSFDLNITVTKDTPQQLSLEVCAEYLPIGTDDPKLDSNMAVLEVNLPTGYASDNEGLQKIEQVDRVKRTETKNEDSTVVVYFDGLSIGEKKCIPIEASKTHAVAKQKPAAVSIYDYYATERRATAYYEVMSSLCDICVEDDCGSGCKK